MVKRRKGGVDIVSKRSEKNKSRKWADQGSEVKLFFDSKRDGVVSTLMVRKERPCGFGKMVRLRNSR